MKSPVQTVTVRTGDFLWEKVPQSHVGYRVVEKKQSVLKDKLYLERTMKLLLKIVVV